MKGEQKKLTGFLKLRNNRQQQRNVLVSKKPTHGKNGYLERWYEVSFSLSPCFSADYVSWGKFAPRSNSTEPSPDPVFLDNAPCKPRLEAVEVPQPEDKNALHFPLFVTLHRCRGACSERPFETRCEAQGMHIQPFAFFRIAWRTSALVKVRPITNRRSLYCNDKRVGNNALAETSDFKPIDLQWCFCHISCDQKPSIHYFLISHWTNRISNEQTLWTQQVATACDMRRTTNLPLSPDRARVYKQKWCCYSLDDWMRNLERLRRTPKRTLLSHF